MQNKYAFFPGCVLHAAAKEAEISTVAVAKRLGMQLEEIPGWTCCGASHVQDIDPETSLLTNARNLALAERMGLTIVTACSTCALMLRQAKATLLDGKKDWANERLAAAGLEFKGTVEVKHLLWVLADTCDEWADKITHPQTQLKVAPFYGCHTVRPPKIMDYESHLNPQSLEKIIRVCGATPVSIPERLKCCGFHAVFPAETAAHRMTSSAVSSAAKAGADCLLTPCPLCHMQLDMYQPDVLSSACGDTPVPVLHLPQIMAMALGLDKKEIGLSRHIIDAKPLLTTSTGSFINTR
ncbi:CoB--CoM heterodisulfide reductase iron-sulfur subunit B family protein [Halodesulfovibrio aestuarii]|uniref:CoB--CoM heterodisulfide reductase iron-sulfur subunit B family protein n=1 Tax=Halodesulfovibrio aestuarii TaxID=126333 RepID=A0ABV4JWC5_9BACT